MHKEINDEIDIKKIIKHLKENLKTILFISFLITSVTTGYVYFLPSLYSSSVTLSFSNQEMSKLSSIIPNKFKTSEHTKSELESIKLTIQTKQFIDSVIKDLSLSKKFYIKNKLRKEEVYSFTDLKITIKTNKVQSEALYGQDFKIEPIDSTSYKLSIDSLNYSKIINYNTIIQENLFSIHVIKKFQPKYKAYFILLNNEKLLANEILNNLSLHILSNNILKITYNNTVPQRAKEIVKIIAQNFIDYTLKKKTNELTQTLTFLDSQLQEIKQTIQSEGGHLKKYQETSNSFMPLSSSELLIKKISTKKEKLKKIQFQLTEVKEFEKALIFNQFNTVSLLNSGINIDSIQALIESFRKNILSLSEMQLQLNNTEQPITQNNQLNLLINELNNKKKLLANLTFNFTNDHPQVYQTKNDVLSLKNKISLYITTFIQKLKTNQKLTKNKIIKNINVTKNSLKRKIKIFEKDIKKQKESLDSIPGKNLINEELKRNFTLSENIYTFLLQKKMEFKISKASTIANTQIIEKATEPVKSMKPNKKLMVIISFIIGLVLGILFTTLRILFDNRIRDVSTIGTLTNIPIYGTLPNKTHRQFFTESLRSIRTNLHFAVPNKKECMKILISSSIAGEGKSLISAELANVISQSKKKTLILDLDLRKPRLHDLFKKSNEVGISDYFLKNKNIEQLIQPIHNNLDFIATGKIPFNPSELLMSNEFDELMRKLMKRYNYILFDTAPIGIVFDTLHLLKYADITLFIFDAKKAKKDYIESFNTLCLEKDIKSVGIILNQAKLNKKDIYNYGYGYTYGDN